MTTPQQLKSDMLTLLIAFRINQHMKPSELMNRVKRTCIILLRRTTDELTRAAYNKILQAINNKRYTDVSKTLTLAEISYYREFKL